MAEYYTVSVAGLGVTRGLGVQLAEGLEIVQRELVALQMEKDVLESTS